MLGHQIIMFIVNTIIGICLNPMNLLAYRFNDLYFSLTLFYGGLIMASNMIWTHEIINYIANNKFNIHYFIFGILLLILVTLVIRNQSYVDDKQYLRRMISHHSTALTTSHKILKRTTDEKLAKLAKNIIDTQEKEINIMRNMLN